MTSHLIGTWNVYLGIKRTGREADHLHLMPRLRMLDVSFPIRLHGTGTIYVYFICVKLMDLSRENYVLESNNMELQHVLCLFHARKYSR
jgi:hypothetical protein